MDWSHFKSPDLAVHSKETFSRIPNVICYCYGLNLVCNESTYSYGNPIWPFLCIESPGYFYFKITSPGIGKYFSKQVSLDSSSIGKSCWKCSLGGLTSLLLFSFKIYVLWLYIFRTPHLPIPPFLFHLIFADSAVSNLLKDGDVYMTKRKEAYRKFEM